MSQKRHQKQLKRRKNKQKDAAHFKAREFSRFANQILAQMQQEDKKAE
jgi:hypothetical protein